MSESGLSVKCHPPLLTALPSKAGVPYSCGFGGRRGWGVTFGRSQHLRVQWASDTSFAWNFTEVLSTQDENLLLTVNPSWCTCQHLCFYCSVWETAGTAEIETMTSTSQERLSVSSVAILVQCVARRWRSSNSGPVFVKNQSPEELSRDLCCNAWCRQIESLGGPAATGGGEESLPGFKGWRAMQVGKFTLGRGVANCCLPPVSLK